MRTAARRIETDGLLALAERFCQAAEPDERGGAVAAAGGAVRAQRHGTVVVPQRLPVAALLVPLVPGASDFLKTRTAGRRRRRAARRRPRRAAVERSRVNAGSRGSRSSGTSTAAAHDAAVAVVPRAGSEHDRASARRLRRCRRPSDAA